MSWSCSRRSRAAPAAQAWTWPVDGPVLRPFSLGPDPYAAASIAASTSARRSGRRCVAPAAGTVSFVGADSGRRARGHDPDPDGYAVTLLQLGSTSVVRGSVVAEGAVVGAVGESADAVTSAPHVHLGVRVAADPDGYVDPLGLLPARGPEPVPAPPALVPEPVVVPAPPVVASEPPVVVAEVPPAPSAAAAEAPVPAAPAAEPPVAIPATAPQPQPVAVPPDAAGTSSGESAAAEVRAPVPGEIAAVQTSRRSWRRRSVPAVVEPCISRRSRGRRPCSEHGGGTAAADGRESPVGRDAGAG